MQAVLGSGVRLLGAKPQEEVRQHLSRASVFVLPSVVTSLGTATAFPVAPDGGDGGRLAGGVHNAFQEFRELVLDGVTGLLADHGDPEGLAQAIERVSQRSGPRNRRLGTPGPEARWWRISMLPRKPSSCMRPSGSLA